MLSAWARKCVSNSLPAHVCVHGRKRERERERERERVGGGWGITSVMGKERRAI